MKLETDRLTLRLLQEEDILSFIQLSNNPSLNNFSTGRYDVKWQTFNLRFLKKFPQLSNLPSMARYANIHVKLQNIEQVERLHTGLLHHRFGV